MTPFFNANWTTITIDTSAGYVDPEGQIVRENLQLESRKGVVLFKAGKRFRIQNISCRLSIYSFVWTKSMQQHYWSLHLSTWLEWTWLQYCSNYRNYFNEPIVNRKHLFKPSDNRNSQHWCYNFWWTWGEYCLSNGTCVVPLDDRPLLIGLTNKCNKV